MDPLENHGNGIDGQTIQHRLLNIDLIKPYDRNPRRTANPFYDEIKTSIRAKGGLNNALMVTRRPGDSHFMVASGGNTRLMILKELWKETQLEAFYKIDCLVVPWVSDSQALSSHLIENELRGEMTLIDKAQALRDLKTQLEQENVQILSLREFSRQLKKMGYLASPRQLSRFEYAAEFLQSLIPIALAAGLGSRPIDRLRKIETTYRQCLAAFTISQPFEPIFAQALLEVDSENLEFDVLQRRLDNYLATTTGQPLNRIRLQIDTLMFDALEEDESAFAELTGLASESDYHSGNIPQTLATDCHDIFLDHESVLSDCHHSTLQTTDPPSEPLQQSRAKDADKTDTTGPLAIPSNPLNDLDTLRHRCCELVEQLSSDTSITLPVKPWQQGYGFYLDLPEQPIQDELMYFLFWLLVGLSEQHLSIERIKLAQEMNFAKSLLTDQKQSVFGLIGTPASLVSLGHSALLSNKLSESALVKVFQLIQLCRQIRFGFRESDIFECLTIEQAQVREHLDKLNDDQSPAGENDDE